MRLGIRLGGVSGFFVDCFLMFFFRSRYTPPSLGPSMARHCGAGLGPVLLVSFGLLI